jgi:U32 family peptidase
MLLNKKPELLAPAGSIESFHAAFDAGADAVYLGLTDFNARLRARNFTVQTLSYLVAHAHGLKRKIYITLNILIKQSELEKVVHLLYQLEQIGVDGVIVQDLGIVGICRRFFPKLRLHASTQMSLHSSLGVAAAQKLGIRRVVLARELTLKEIAAAGKNSSMELEVFVHGALCYSFSGMCLASSFLGGSSGNRGRCTQVCRRPFSARATKGHFFSPSDFCSLSVLEKLREIGISCLKIEGRMKSADYVSTVVGLYREALDAPRRIPDLMKKVDADLGRKKTSFFLDGVKNTGVIDPDGATGTGLLIGKITRAGGGEIEVTGEEAVGLGDLLRIQPQSGFEGQSVRVADLSRDQGVYRLQLKDRIACAVGDDVYLSRLAAKSEAGKKRRAITHKPIPFKHYYNNVNTVLSAYLSKRDQNNSPAKSRLPRLLLKIDDAKWLSIIESSDFDALILSLEKDAFHALFADSRWTNSWAKKSIVGFPPFIAEAEIGEWKKLVQAAQKNGVYRAMCQNLGHKGLCDPGMKIFADAMVWCFNGAAQKMLIEGGFSGFTYSTEDDYPNIAAASSTKAMAYLFAYIPLFVSRICCALGPEEHLMDSFDNEFRTVEKHGLSYLLAQKPFGLFHKRKKLEDVGIRTFIIDLSFLSPDKGLYSELVSRYTEGTKVPESSMFNFKAGIK